MIRFDSVNKYYGDFHVLKKINLEIQKGEVVVVIGPSGSGKVRCFAVLITWKPSLMENCRLMV